MAAGILLSVVGAWVLSQVLAGNALGRLGISGAATETKPAQHHAEGEMHKRGSWVPGIGYVD